MTKAKNQIVPMLLMISVLRRKPVSSLRPSAMTGPASVSAIVGGLGL